jgi:hypothetical protein
VRKRQVKKFAKNARKNMTPYRQAFSRGSKKLTRRHRAFCRYYEHGAASWEAMRRAGLASDHARAAVASLTRLSDVPRVWAQLALACERIAKAVEA